MEPALSAHHIRFPTIVIAPTVHECAHGLMAKFFGDQTILSLLLRRLQAAYSIRTAWMLPVFLVVFLTGMVIHHPFFTAVYTFAIHYYNLFINHLLY